MTHKGYKRPKGKERNDMQAWEGHEPMEVPMGMHSMPDGTMMKDEEMMMDKKSMKKKMKKKMDKRK